MSKGLRSIRPLAAESLRGVEPSKVVGRRPKFEWVDPGDLYVEEDYQREILENGIALVRKIYAGFSWARFKPPICVRVPESGNVLVAIDGQHTATAAATHPEIEEIPVMVVDAEAVADRAASFVGHNRDRIALTAQTIYFAELAANDEIACMIDRACKASGAAVPRKSISSGDKYHPVGTTIALGTLKAIAKRQGEEVLTRILSLAVRAKRTPVRADELAALAVVTKFAAPAVDGRIVAAMLSKSPEEWTADARLESLTSGETTAGELAKMWLRALSISTEAAPTLKSSFNSSKNLIAAVAPQKPGFAPKAAAKAPPKAPPAPAAPPAAKPNGKVNVDIMNDRVTHRGRTVSLAGRFCDGTMMVARLAAAMPRTVDLSFLAKSVGTSRDIRSRVAELSEKINPILRDADLEVRLLDAGCVLVDLGEAP